MGRGKLAFLLLVISIIAFSSYFTRKSEVVNTGEVKDFPAAALNLPLASQQVNSQGAISSPALAKKFSSPEEFRAFTETTFQNLPKIEKFKKLNAEDVHEAPLLLRKAGSQLGEIAEAVKLNPQLAPVAFQFYTDCSKEKDFPSSIRALCYSHHLHWAGELKKHSEETLVPLEIRELAKKLN